MLDPICGMPVAEDSPFHVGHEGQDIRFCSKYCADIFARNPSRGSIGCAPENEELRTRTIAYFSMEIALEPSVPTYAGGLGILAGDTLRSCADLDIPVVAVTLLYREGYLRQSLDEFGNQSDATDPWPTANFVRLLSPVVEVNIEGRSVFVRAYRYEIVGIGKQTVPVLLLDTDVAQNEAADRRLTTRLYGGDDRCRLAQEVVLGIGGVRLLAALGFNRLRRFHLNEGHAALAPLELVRSANEGRPSDEWEFKSVSERCVFTTHTPVAAGHDQFEWDLARRVIGELVPDPVAKMLAVRDGRLNMTALALNLGGFVNGVAKRHGETSRSMFPGYGIHHVTNGVHSATWTAPAFRRLYDSYLPGWDGDPAMLRNAGRISDREIWAAHREAKGALIARIRSSTGRMLSTDALTIGFARRATEYKRPNLIFSDVARLRRIVAAHGPLQLVFAGKAHPRDEVGKDIIRRIVAISRVLGDEVPVVFLPNYDMEVARLVTAGVDLWLNTPKRPLEASGTSGMKAAHNGVPCLSILDGWWIEGHVEGVTGWSIGGLATTNDDDRADAEDLYRKLEIILPRFHCDHMGWIDVMKNSIALNASYFNTHRMVQQYVANAYI